MDHDGPISRFIDLNKWVNSQIRMPGSGTEHRALSSSTLDTASRFRNGFDLLDGAKAVSQRILSKTPTYKVIFVTGVQFYVLSFVISLANIVIILSPFSTVVHTVLVQSFDRILHAILAERLVLSIRGTLSAHPQPASTISVMEFYGARISSREH